ncbi:hypothetical protein TgHK011_005890 [Trichoderma gracile]|nr:hypothetical protein TgHK011_005890 [Trichoderma gracile]
MEQLEGIDHHQLGEEILGDQARRGEADKCQVTLVSNGTPSIGRHFEAVPGRYPDACSAVHFDVLCPHVPTTWQECEFKLSSGVLALLTRVRGTNLPRHTGIESEIHGRRVG